MTDLIIVCRNKRQAKNLYDRTCGYLMHFNHPRSYGPSKNVLYVKDHVIGDSARFITLHEIKHKHIDDGLHGVRIEGDFFDKWLDNAHRNLPMVEAMIEVNKKFMINTYLNKH